MSAKRLISSSIIAAVAAAAPALVANAGTTTFDSQGAFEAAAGGAGTQTYVEDFESFSIFGGYTFVSSPLTGLGDGSLSMSSSDGNIFIFKGSYYYASIPTNAAGVIEGRTMTNAVSTGASAMGFDLHGTSSFTAGYFSEFNYSVYDMGGALLASGQYSADGSTGGYFGVVSDSDIGWIDISATRFDGALTAAVYADNIQVWAVPTPGVVTMLGLGGLVATRRRR